jgi:sulfite exporter TauE/SafE
VWIIVLPVGHCIAWCGSLFFLLTIVLPGVDQFFLSAIVLPGVDQFVLLAIVLSGVDHCFSCWPLYCLSFLFDSNYTFGIFKPFH